MFLVQKMVTKKTQKFRDPGPPPLLFRIFFYILPIFLVLPYCILSPLSDCYLLLINLSNRFLDALASLESMLESEWLTQWCFWYLTKNGQRFETLSRLSRLVADVGLRGRSSKLVVEVGCQDYWLLHLACQFSVFFIHPVDQHFLILFLIFIPFWLKVKHN